LTGPPPRAPGTVQGTSASRHRTFEMVRLAGRVLQKAGHRRCRRRRPQHL